MSNVIRLPKELAKPKQKSSKGWSISQFIEKRSLPWALMGLFIGFTYSGVLVFIPIELNSMGAGVWGSVFFALFALMIIISRPLVGKVYARYGSRFVIYPGVGLFIVGLAILGVVSTPVGIICTAPLTWARLWSSSTCISSVSSSISTNRTCRRFYSHILFST